MSGITCTPRFSKTSSASGVVGPLAPSTMIFAWTSLATSLVITPPSAAGMRMSQSCTRMASPLIRSPPLNPSRLRSVATSFIAAFRSMPSGL